MPLVALLLVKDALNLLLELYPDNPSLQTKFWLSMQGFLCFGMPSQAARDFIQDGPKTVNNIKWRDSNMHNHREELMLQILKWAGYAS